MFLLLIDSFSDLLVPLGSFPVLSLPTRVFS
jgi:hypothetical protein